MSGFWRERRVFVTGGTGIVGSWLVRDLLDRGAKVSALVRDANPQSETFRCDAIQRLSVVSGDQEDFWTLERAINRYEPDTVFHLGAQAIVERAQRYPMRTFESNVRGTYNLLEACRQHGDLVRRVVIASSDKAYGTHERLPYTEDVQLKGRNPYDVSKACADMIGQAYHHSYGMPVAIARCGNVFGGGDLNWNRIVPSTIRSFLRGERPEIRSDGKYVRDYIYVKDAVGAYRSLAQGLDKEEVRGEAFNFSGERPTTVLEIVSAIQRIMQCEHIEPDVQNTAQGEIRDQYLSAEKARTVLGWKPAYDLESGLRETVAWYRDYLRHDS
jgi:CDP-glucose 4,6-dehydratase